MKKVSLARESGPNQDETKLKDLVAIQEEDNSFDSEYSSSRSSSKPSGDSGKHENEESVHIQINNLEDNVVGTNEAESPGRHEKSDKNEEDELNRIVED